MPAITIGATGVGVIPDRSLDNQPRTCLLVTLISGDGYFSWLSNETTAGTPLAVNVPIAFEGVNYSAPGYVYSSGGGVVNYTEFPPRS